MLCTMQLILTTLSILTSVATVARSKCSRYKIVSSNSATLWTTSSIALSVAKKQAQKFLFATLATRYSCYTFPEPSLQAASRRFQLAATVATLVPRKEVAL